MPRHTQPREVAIAKGAPRKHPERYRKTPPACEYALGNAPGFLTDAEQAVWFELQTYAPVGVLKGADRFMLEIAACLLAERRELGREFKVGKYGPMISCLGRLGFSAADREKLGTEKPKEDNEFNTF